MIKTQRTTSEKPDFINLVTRLDTYLWEVYPETQAQYDTFNVIEKNDTVVIAYKDDVAVGCGCFKEFDQETVEIKRMFVSPESRGLGVSHLIMAELEKWAAELGFSYLILETLHKQAAAISLYQKRGYQRIENYGPYAGLPNSICMRKAI
ncbi:GNAT family N-acetyltransferase [Spirosoma flavum]|uniref:GNAT family N-acetyltransferase n=1 Tax=Spirosoma flavum TaxID=2048557 RepID=A0ABW6AIN1_9BACT